MVVYASPAVALDWVPSDVHVILVHNDGSLNAAAVDHPRVTHLHTGRNLGFGAAVNRALPHVGTGRIVLCNPDVVATSDHWRALVDADHDEVVTVPLVDALGRPEANVNRYPGAAALLLGALRAGRLAPRGGRARRLLAPALGGYGRAHVAGLRGAPGAWPLTTHWASAALVSLDVERLRAAGGFDEAFFLYYEDVDLCARLARRHPAMRLRRAATAPALHLVGATATLDGRAERERLRSAQRYADRQSGGGWRACTALLSARAHRRGATAA